MHKLFDINEEKFSIRCIRYYDKDPRGITHWVIATHGFGGNKENRAVEKFAERITTKYKHYGVICFDWPCHGKDARNKLVLSDCLTYLDLVNKYAREELHAEKLYNYSASMGAYLTLLYIHLHGNPYEKIALRCPAIKFYQITTSLMSDDEKEKLSKKKEVNLGYERKITVTEDFLNDIKENDITKWEYFDYADDILILHGTKDKMAPMEDAAAFADANVIEMIPVQNADHPFTDPDTMDFAIQKIITFFAP